MLIKHLRGRIEKRNTGVKYKESDSNMQIYTQLPEKGYKFKRKNLARYKNFNYNRKVARGE
ncbi:MAG: hypothetical protein EGR94_01290 [Blautia obeum]|nr:hypothetical protein [Blautia obeum]